MTSYIKSDPTHRLIIIFMCLSVQNSFVSMSESSEITHIRVSIVTKPPALAYYMNKRAR
jgi:hypothetical protein